MAFAVGNASGSLDEVKQLLTSLAHTCVAKVARSRAASRIPEEDLEVLRKALNTVVLQTRHPEPLFHPDDR